MTDTDRLAALLQEVFTPHVVAQWPFTVHNVAVALVRAGVTAPLDAERLAEAMDGAFDYSDHDNAIPTLLFYDDFDAFWRPFATKVAREYDGTPEAGDA